MQTTPQRATLYTIKFKGAGQRATFTAPYQNRSEAIQRISTWLEIFYGESNSLFIISILPTRCFNNKKAP